MHVKTYTGSHSQDVLAQVKADLGSDAVILGSRELTGPNGERIFEITAGLDRKPENSGSTPGAGMAGSASRAYTRAAGASEQSRQPDPNGRSSTTANVEEGTPHAEKFLSPPPAWENWHREWSHIKGHLYSLMQPAMAWERLTPHQRLALEHLQLEGVENDVTLDLFDALVKSPPTMSMLGALAELVPVVKFEPYRHRFHLLAGPFGSGKTTVALRMGRLARRYEPRAKIAYLNADSARGNGRLVLKHWAELADCAYFETPDAATIRAALRACKEMDLVFIDTQALGRGENLEAKMAALGIMDYLRKAGAALSLTLSPQTDAAFLGHTIQSSQTGLPTSLIWTKLDESLLYGNMVNIAVRYNIPISAFSFSPELSHSFSPCEDQQVWRLLLKHELPNPFDATNGH